MFDSNALSYRGIDPLTKPELCACSDLGRASDEEGSPTRCADYDAGAEYMARRECRADTATLKNNELLTCINIAPPKSIVVI